MGKFTNKRLAVLAAVVAVGLVFGLAGPSWAEYPSKPIQILCAHRAGGGTDSMARLLAKSMGKIFGTEGRGH